MQDGTINTLTLGGNLSVGSGLGSSVLNFDLGTTSGSNDSIVVAGSASTTGTTTINLNSTAIAAGNYTLITAASGGLTIGGGGFTIGTHPSGLFTYDLLSSTANAEILKVTAIQNLPTAYWTGNASFSGGDFGNNNWAFGSTTSNWSSDAAGATDLHNAPNITSTVYFTATNAIANSGAVNTQLDTSYSIVGLNFNTAGSTNTITNVSINTNGVCFFNSGPAG